MPSSFFDSTDDLPGETFSPHVTKLLSASSYPQEPSNATMDMGRQLLFGGLIAPDGSGDEDEDEMVEAESPPKKKTRLNQKESTPPDRDAQEAPKKQRGRPKVSTKDKTAAERRRTQIRLAQRAYRNRKENTITELTHKVESLQDTIKVINTGFARLRENLLNTGVIHSDSVIVQQVADLMQTLSEATEPSPADGDKTSEGEDGGGGEAQERAVEQDPARLGWRSEGAVPMDMQGQTHPADPGPVVKFHSNTRGADAGYGTLDMDGQYLTDFQSHTAPPTSSRTFSAFRNDIVLSLDEPQASMAIERFPHRHSYTYSFQESTFARRLHRLCLEKAFQRIMSPHVDPNWLLRTFRFTYNFTTKERIAGVFKSILSRGTDEPLENWRSPYIHVGGAGLHFPRTDANGQPVYPPNLLSPGHVQAPWRMAVTETEPPSNSIDEILESIGFGGKWFDCHDVEEYLKTKGLYPEPQASFMVVDSSMLGIPIPARKVAYDSSPGSLYSAQFSRSSNSASASDESITSLGQQDGFTDVWPEKQQDYNPGDFDIEFPLSTINTPAREGRLLTIEVQKFLERLSDESVCLGRAPGFRQEHVDNALFMALEEAF